MRGNLPPLRRPVLCWPNACPVRACAGPCENRRLHPFSEGALGHHDVDLAALAALYEKWGWDATLYDGAE